MTRLLGLWLCLAVVVGAVAAADVSSATDERDTVVLLHGLWRSDRSMRSLQRSLEGRGYRVVNLRYPSVRRSFDELVSYIEERLGSCCSQYGGRLHFVTHSLGGIVLRGWVPRHKWPNLGRVVMLAPPNRGSEVVDVLAGVPLLWRLLGETGLALGTDAAAIPARLGPVTFELGIIAGNSSVNPLFSWMIPGSDDGAVAVERTRIEGMSDFLVVGHSHTFIMNSPLVHAQVAAFLGTGAFER